MYLSKLTLNPRARRVQRELGNAYELHRTLLRAFPETLLPEERVLFRVDVDPRNGVPGVLVQSFSPPAWDPLQARADFLLQSPQSKTFDIAFSPGQTLAFRLRANPTVKHSAYGQRQGRRDPLYDEAAQRAWFVRKGESGGFRVLRLNIVQEGNATAWKSRADGEKRRKLTHFAVRFEGLLQVSDPAALWETVKTGVGPAKGFGFGLLSLAPSRFAA